jgi:hypothetical protein
MAGLPAARVQPETTLSIAAGTRLELCSLGRQTPAPRPPGSPLRFSMPTVHRARATGRSLLVACLVTLTGAATVAQEPAASPADPFGRKYPPRVYQATRLQGQPPVIDGRFDDAAWQAGEWAGDYRQQMPVEGAEPSQPTELKILYDERHVYVAIRAFDDPALVHRYPGRRDDFGGYAVDIVGICFDSYNDKRTGFEFDLTAGGGKIDLLLGNGETEWDTTWNAVWDGKVAHDAQGWTAEFRIPFNQLRFGPQDEQIWGMHAWRWIARNAEETQWQLIPRQNTGRMHQLGELHGIRDLPRPRHVELLPHVVGSARSGPTASDTGTDHAGAIGLDAKLGLSSNFTLDATVNPDFGQIEADPSVVNLTAYETFYEERRPFFLEGRKIFDFQVDDSDQLFYSRRIGHAPSMTPPLSEGERLRSPESTTILSAVKVTGKTSAGLSVGVLQSLTQEETATITAPVPSRRSVVEPFSSYTVARVHKDWDKGNTSLGGLLTQTHRDVDDVSLMGLPANATSGGIDFTRYLGNRAWIVEANGVFSHVSGDRAAIERLQTNPVHYYQRPDAAHLGVDEERTSLAGHGGSVRAGTSDTGRLRATNDVHWYSPGLDMNDLGYLRQADVIANRVSLGWSEPRPRGVFRTYSVELSREDQWDFGGLHTRAESEVEASATFQNRWAVEGELAFNRDVDTRALRGGPALRLRDHYAAGLGVRSDAARRLSFSLAGERARSVDDASYASELAGALRLRLSNRLAFSSELGYERLGDELQYVTTASTSAGPRYVLARIDQESWAFTFRADLAITPDLTLQYYGSPFIGTGRYATFKHATETLAHAYGDRFHAYGPDEITPLGPRAYAVTERDGTTFSFSNPDFSFRQFRSNSVLRWEYRPGSSLYVVWSQGRTGEEPYWERRFGGNWNGLWRARADNVLLVKASYWFSP